MAARTGQLRAFVTVTALAGTAAVAWAVPQVDPVSWALAAALVAGLEWISTTLRDEVKVSLANVVVLVALLADGPPLAIACTVAVVVPVALRATPPRVLRTVFNVSQLALSATVASLIYTLATNATGASFPGGGAVAALLLASAMYTATNHALVSVAVALTSRETFRGAFRTVLPSMAMQAPNVGLALLAAAVLLSAGPEALALLAVPVAIARASLTSFQRIDVAYDRMVRGFVKAIEVKDLYTRGHSERVAMLAVAVAEELELDYDQRRLIRYSALLHDVGKIGVPGCVLNKAGPLDDDEFAHIKRHPTLGAEILRDIDFLAPALDIVRCHHERLDGRGYPAGLGAEDLGPLVRIVTAVDAFDAMTSTRSYRRAVSVEEAVEELRRCAGRQVDATVVEALAVAVDTIGWTPTLEFASRQQLHGTEVPEGELFDRFDEASEHTTGP